MVMAIRKALIAAAGFGTRFLPVTKTLQKEMLPVLKRPAIDYIVSDCVAAGVEEIVFVISEHNQQIRHFYESNQRLQSYLHDRGKIGVYDRGLRHLHEQARFRFIVQPDSEQYGTGSPVKLAEPELSGEEAFLVFMGDNFVYNPHGDSEVKQMIDEYEGSGATALVSCTEVPEHDLHLYGVARYEERDGRKFLQEMVEKPARGTAPSRLANISRYIFTPIVFDVLRHQQINQQQQELYLTDTLSLIANEHDVLVHAMDGEYMDCGTPENWLLTNVRLAADDPEMRQRIRGIVG
jgi:UTP--glucose-1-phosphate uridylyltransferase